MTIEKTLKRPMVSFVVFSNIIFWVFLALIGVGMMLDIPKILTDILIVISAWSSTISFVIFFNKIYPGLKLKEFVKKQFAPKLRFSVLSIIIIIQILIFSVTIFILPGARDTQNFTLSFSGIAMFLFIFFHHLVQGPLGEELSWRGYVLNELQKMHSPFIAALIVGVLWGLWHAPLWLLTSGYIGVNLIKYITLFMVGIISVTIIMTFFYNLNKNLLVPIIIHQLFNFLLSLIKAETLDVLLYTMIFYFAVAVILIVINPKQKLYKK
ncbi:CPBP family intramembrane glutamic endopeptidase [Abyssisolibacter fermentans]|uniref:CPBP family intramembrane glutamic endopeptidase n=1 Tax=Abyssisolibacter fermentans TaxID=1766203 RepID=UPI000A8ED0D8|nr:type II CAAX endopeptidase family protein [Abyssisolibacter fermentans]